MAAMPTVRYIAGIDEAGLGPLLGPLTIGFSLIRLEGHGAARLSELPGVDLWRCLGGTVSRDVKDRDRCIVVCDSKQLYTPARGIGPLEDSLLPFLTRCGSDAGAAAPGTPPANFNDYWQRVCVIPASELARYPWYRDTELELPRKGSSDKIEIRGRLLERAMTEQKTWIEAVGALPVLEGEFNRLLHVHGNKADAHFSAIASVIARLWDRCGNLCVMCDHLGARRWYADALRVLLKPDKLDIVNEEEEVSAYTLERSRQGRSERLYLTFTVKGDDKSFAVALASMTAKYTRELCMGLFNRYFTAQQPGLKPSAGYYTDGKRFLEDTVALRKKLAIPDELLIRAR